MLLVDGCYQPVKECTEFFVALPAIQFVAQMPVGSVKDFHRWITGKQVALSFECDGYGLIYQGASSDTVVFSYLFTVSVMTSSMGK